VRNVREMHNIHVNKSRHDVEEVMSMSDFDDDKIRSNYLKIERGMMVACAMIIISTTLVETNL
jgi:hypothetical protein